MVPESARDRADEARRIAELLRLVPGQRIAELEAGSGYYAERFARALGAASPVQAVDSDPADAAALEQRAAAVGVPWVHASPSTGADPRLPTGAVDVALIADSYASIPEPYAYFARLAPAIAAGGHLAVVALDIDIQLGGMPLALVQCELEALGYRLDASYRLVPADRYLAVFTPPDALAPVSSLVPCRSDGSRSAPSR